MYNERRGIFYYLFRSTLFVANTQLMRTKKEKTTLTRRGFIAAAATTMAAALAAAFLWPVWEFLSPPKTGKEEQETAAIPLSKVGIGMAHFFEFQGHPSVVLQPSPGKFIALSAVCTHLGCIVEWRPRERIFFCPCHGGKFSPEGKVLAGPPPRPLPSYRITVRKDQVIIG